MSKSARQSNIELLRIVLMLMIITHHVIVHGMGLKGIKEQSFVLDKFVYAELFFNSFAVIGVNGFIFISGYFGMKFKLRTVLSFIFQALFYSLGIFLIFNIFIYKTPLDYTKLFYAFFPISKTAWWFLTTYLGLYFLAPFLNKGIEEIKKKDLLILLLGLLFFDCCSGFIFGAYPKNGYTIFHFITLYVLAGYIRKYVPNIKKPFLCFIILSLIIFSICIFLLDIEKYPKIWKTFSYNNPLLMLSAVMIFFTFKNISIQSKFINTISCCVFGVYLLHDHPIINKLLIKTVSQVKTDYMQNEVLLAIIIIAIIIGIFIIGTIVEYIRKSIFDKLIDKIDSSIKITE